MSLAIITVIGRCVGAGDFSQAAYYAKKMMKIAYLINGLCCLGVILTLPLTLSLYGVTDEAREIGRLLVIIHSGCAILFWPASFCLANVLLVANDARFPTCATIPSMVIFSLGSCYRHAVGVRIGAEDVLRDVIADCRGLAA